MRGFVPLASLCGVAFLGVARAQTAAFPPAPAGTPSAPSASASAPAEAPSAPASAEPEPSAAPSTAPAPAPTPAPTPAPAPGPAAARAPTIAPAYAPPPSAAEDPFAGEQTRPRVAPRKGLVGVARFGLRMGGSGELDAECSGDCSAFDGGSSDFDDATSFVIGGDLMVHLSPEFRLGAGLLFSPDTSIDVDGASEETSMGSDLSAMAVVEGVFDLNPKTAFTLRGQGGLFVLFPGGDLDDAIDRLKQICGSASSGSACDVDDGPYPGFTLGGGPGLRFALEKVALRVELLFQWYSVANVLRTQGNNTAGSSIDVSYTWRGTRFFLAGGVEF